jgi:hypothetical protein
MTIVVGVSGADGSAALVSGGSVDKGSAWEIVGGPWGGGTILVADSPFWARAWAPPGVPLSGVEDEPLERWRFASRAPDADDCETRTEVWALAQVVDAVMEQFRDWALGATRDALRGLELAVRSFWATEDETRAADAQTCAELLEAELREVTAADQPEPAAVVPQHFYALEHDEVLTILSDLDFERLVATVLRAEFSLPPEAIRVYAYAHRTAPSVGALLQGARDEAARLARRAGERLLYWFVTSTKLSDALRAQVTDLLADAIPSPDHVIGAHELRAMAARHTDVAGQHVKYLMACDAYARAGASPRTAWLEDGMAERLPELVQTEAFERARVQLREQRAVVITGRRGSGKTTLARMLLAVSSGDDEAPLVIDDLTDPAAAMAAVAEAKKIGRAVVVVMRPAATAQHIAAPVIDLSRHVRRDRALMLYNRLWHDDAMDRCTRMALAQPAGYRAIIDAPEFTPRWCADVLAQAPWRPAPALCDEAADDDVDEIFGRLRRRDQLDQQTPCCRG